MKKYFNGCFVVFALLMSCSINENDSVKQAHEKNLNSSIDDEISKFMTEAADARMMNIEQGKLAVQKGNSDLVKNYGQKMITDNNRLLKELRTMAATKNITLPAALSNEKARGLEDLKEEEGKEFDEQFIKMMTRDHRRDVDAFEDAVELKDQDVRAFASRYLPMIQEHLASIEAVNESNKRITEGEQPQE